ncbi:hypothetical protein EHS13_08430 [Paenibacillus psychroresistens]|uniref:Uncharacterized protein n=1 Tax=Paenibacillus psychroresistens TaxID=1778678 RepID=A0A6B8REI5_9BACL|nr:hypothetical protein [Paenibacillus psychroresistens]QGQ94901.1 hypothetical protein EHS13_08430 [Paenibacillus psychroresistens]
MKALRYAIILMILVQLFLPWAMPTNQIYHNRIDYNITKESDEKFEPALEQIKLEIKHKHLKDYIIIIGDSVLYGSPGNSDQAVNAFMEDSARKSPTQSKLRIFNLSYPSMMAGDIYVMLLKLDELGISTDHIMINFRYASFVARDTNPPIKAVFWLMRDLKSLDSSAYQHILPQMKDSHYKEPAFFYGQFMDKLYHDFLPEIKLYSYKDYIVNMLQRSKLKLLGHKLPDDAIQFGDPRPWTVKETLTKYVQGDVIKKSYSDTPFNMTESNPDIYFIEKILKHQEGKETMVVMNGANQTLLKQYVEKPGYQTNLQAIDAYFQQKPVKYVNLEGKIDDSLYTDHTHFIAEGYKAMADLLWPYYAK